MRYFNELETMLLNILEEGEQKVWNSLDKIANPIKRCEARKLYWRALEKINRGMQDEQDGPEL